jgi:hypothetical protein
MPSSAVPITTHQIVGYRAKGRAWYRHITQVNLTDVEIEIPRIILDIQHEGSERSCNEAKRTETHYRHVAEEMPLHSNYDNVSRHLDEIVYARDWEEFKMCCPGTSEIPRDPSHYSTC